MVHVTLPPGSPGSPPHRHSGPAFGYVVEGEMIFELDVTWTLIASADTGTGGASTEETTAIFGANDVSILTNSPFSQAGADPAAGGVCRTGQGSQV